MAKAKSTKSTKSKPRYFAPALEKGLKIIELLAKEAVPMSIGEIAENINKSRNEIFRMLAVLQENGYITKLSSSDKFIVTNRLFDLGMRVPPTSTLIENIVPVMRKLSNKIWQSSHLSVQTFNHIVVIARVENPAPFGFSARVGMSRDIFSTASGKLFLAHIPKPETLQLMNKFSAINGVRKRKELQRELDEIETDGMLIKPSTFIDGIVDICAPIMQNTEKMIASLSVPYVASSEVRLSVDETADILREVVCKISDEIVVHRNF